MIAKITHASTPSVPRAAAQPVLAASHRNRSPDSTSGIALIGANGTSNCSNRTIQKVRVRLAMTLARAALRSL